MPDIHESFCQLPFDIRNVLVTQYGSSEKAIEYFTARFGTYAMEIMDSMAKQNSRLGPNDPIIGVNVATGKIHFNHLDEFYISPWDEYHPRPGGHMEVFKLLDIVENQSKNAGE